MYEIFLGPAARRFLKKADKHIYDRIMAKIRELKNEPFPSGVKRIVQRKEKVYRVRAGKYRVQYAVFRKKKEILISDIDKRPRAY